MLSQQIYYPEALLIQVMPIIPPSLNQWLIHSQASDRKIRHVISQTTPEETNPLHPVYVPCLWTD
jgi:hypothetical protein